MVYAKKVTRTLRFQRFIDDKAGLKSEFAQHPDQGLHPLLCSDIAASRLTGRSSAWLERLVWDQEVASSNLVAPTM